MCYQEKVVVLRNNWFFLMLCFLLNCSLCFSQQLGEIRDKSIIVSSDVDLHGDVVKIPKGLTLVIKGGSIKNGTLVGDRTKLKCSGKVFDRVHIEGTWNVPEISTSMFADLSYDNALKDVLALSHPKVQNTIVIEKGDYQVVAQKNADVCLIVTSNSTLIIDGTIRLQPNAFPRCDIIRATGDNINISGNGSIIGDKHTHLATDGEWGMGIRIQGAKNTSVKGVTIKDCWGDCVYVGGDSKNVLIEDCLLDHGRRQGISVTKADSVIIRNCKISNVKGTKPEFGIDLEPNVGDIVDHITIENVVISDCVGGILATVGKKNVKRKTIGNITIKNCTISIYDLYPISLRAFDTATVEGCNIKTNDKRAAINISTSKKVEVRDNKLEIESTLLSSTDRNKNDYTPIQVTDCQDQLVTRNQIDKK